MICFLVGDVGCLFKMVDDRDPLMTGSGKLIPHNMTLLSSYDRHESFSAP